MHCQDGWGWLIATFQAGRKITPRVSRLGQPFSRSHSNPLTPALSWCPAIEEWNASIHRSALEETIQYWGQNVDSIAVSVFADIFIELTNTVSDGKIQITILILRRGALSTWVRLIYGNVCCSQVPQLPWMLLPEAIGLGNLAMFVVTHELENMKTFWKTVCVSLYLQMRSDLEEKFGDQFNLALLN